MSVKRAYLFIYNLGMALGWAGVCAQVLTAGPETAYQKASFLAKLLQAFSILETLHAASGIVKSGPISNLMQWAGRAHALFVVVDGHPALHRSPCAALMLAVWGLGESTRYPWYAFTQLGDCPYFFTWLRYSAFVVVYPVGMLAELKCMWDALMLLQGPGKLTEVGLDYATFLKALIVVYPFLWFSLYLDLLRKRRKALGNGKAKAA